jgi:hypothetical protein
MGPYLDVIEHEYLDGIIREGLSSFKLVLGGYGAGKTHFLYLVRDLAWKMNYLVSYVTLSPAECPFSALAQVYTSVLSNLTARMKVNTPPVRGIGPLLRSWFQAHKDSGPEWLENYRRGLTLVESTSFANAMAHALSAFVEEDEKTFNRVLLWLSGEQGRGRSLTELGISEGITRSTAFRMIRSLVQWSRAAGFTGTIFLFDEAERGLSLSSLAEKREALDNLRQLVDECGSSKLPSAMFFYAVPDEIQLLEGSGTVYEALKQRLQGIFSQISPSGVRIDLERIELDPEEFLKEVGTKLSRIYEKAYGITFDESVVEESIGNLARAAGESLFAEVSYRRLFIQSLVSAFHMLRHKPHIALQEDEGTALIRGTLRSVETSLHGTQ